MVFILLLDKKYFLKRSLRRCFLSCLLGWVIYSQEMDRCYYCYYAEKFEVIAIHHGTVFVKCRRSYSVSSRLYLETCSFAKYELQLSIFINLKVFCRILSILGEQFIYRIVCIAVTYLQYSSNTMAFCL